MKKFLGVLAGMALLTACSPYTLVNSEVYNGANLSQYKTYRLVTPDMGKLPDGMEMVTYYNIASAIREQLTERGFSEDSTSPILVNIAVTTRREIQTAPAYPPPPAFPYNGPFYPQWIYPPYYWNNYYPNAQVITGIYREGVLTMDMVNVPEKLPLYSASVAAIINGSGDGTYRNLQGIAEAVQVLFSKFPVPILPQYKSK